MAFIKKNNARTILDSGLSFPGLQDQGTTGLQFTLQIGHHKVILSHIERDMIVENWAKLEAEFIHT